MTLPDGRMVTQVNGDRINNHPEEALVIIFRLAIWGLGLGAVA